ncbi:MAG: hemerythrin domain-containing protein [Rhodocyclaceae bacterium]|jgi:hemerythrin|nr:hemerythrin domain-containing protein [Rhodocyclaceae bacterium]
MANRLSWDDRYSIGHESLDAQHRHFFELCNAMADCLVEETAAERFDRLFAELMEKAREHFMAEEALLAACGYPELDDQRSEQEEFAYLVNEIATTENFDRNELQTFLALWWAGHVRGAARNYPAWLAAGTANPAR